MEWYHTGSCVWILIVSVCCICSTSGQLTDSTDWYGDAQKTLEEALNKVPNTNVAKNVILFIGDGMGVTTVTSGRIHKGQLKGNRGEEEQLSFDKFPDVALVKTYNTDQQTSDSAGTATAYLCGIKTKAGVVGLDDHVMRANCSSVPLADKTTCISVTAKNAGKSVGLVTTARVSHATPSPLYAKSPDRNWESDADVPVESRGECADISKQLIDKAIDFQVIMGGGRRSFLTVNDTDPEYNTTAGQRTDGLNLIEMWNMKQEEKNRKLSFIFDKSGFDNVDPANTDYLLGLFEPGHMQYELDRTSSGMNEPSISEMVTKAIQILSKNPNGYFLFVEGARIDHGHHENLAVHALSETVAFDKAVQHAVDETDRGDTLLVVSADHSHVNTMGGYAKRGTDILGENDPNDPDYVVAQDGKPFTIIAYGNGLGYNTPRQNVSGSNVQANKTYNYQSAVPLEYETHGGEDVALYAYGPMSHLFHGVIEQNYIPHAMAYAACMGTKQGQHCDGTTDEPETDKPKCQGNSLENKGNSLIMLTVSIAAVAANSFII